MSGQWVTRGGIKVWRPGKPIPLSTVRPVPPRPDLHHLIACSRCRAKVDESCKTTGGNPTKPHAERIVARICRCGGRLQPRKQLCDICREQARRESWRLRERRKATADRRRWAGGSRVAS